MIRTRIEKYIRALPPLSSAAMRASELLARPIVDFVLVERRLAEDPALAGHVLRLANSSFYGFAGCIGTLREACLVLGANTLHQAITAAAVMACLEGKRNDDWERRWRHASSAAAAARVLADGTDITPDPAATAALLHDIGRLVIAGCEPEAFTRVLSHSRRNDLVLRDAELAVIGIDHGEVGALMAERWHLPEPLRLAIGNHHVPSRHEHPLTDIVHVADVLSHAIDVDDEQDLVPTLDPGAWDRLGLHEGSLPGIFAVVEARAA